MNEPVEKFEILPPLHAWISPSATSLPGSHDYPPTDFRSWPNSLLRTFQSDLQLHRRLLQTSNTANVVPIIYIRAGAEGPDRRMLTSSSASNNDLNSYYDRIETHLGELRNAPADENFGVEPGAVDTALTVVQELKKYNFAPPAVTSLGNDAVVMLWALGDTTYAITVTDGELGYVVRRNKKRVKMVGSIKIDSFKLLELR